MLRIHKSKTLGIIRNIGNIGNICNTGNIDNIMNITKTKKQGQARNPKASFGKVAKVTMRRAGIEEAYLR